MLFIRGVNPDFHPCMRMAEIYADAGFKKYAGREAIVTSGRDREHSTGSLHGYGMAFDLRTRDLTDDQLDQLCVCSRKSYRNLISFSNQRTCISKLAGN